MLPRGVWIRGRKGGLGGWQEVLIVLLIGVLPPSDPAALATTPVSVSHPQEGNQSNTSRAGLRSA